MEGDAEETAYVGIAEKDLLTAEDIFPARSVFPLYYWINIPKYLCLNLPVRCTGCAGMLRSHLAVNILTYFFFSLPFLFFQNPATLFKQPDLKLSYLIFQVFKVKAVHVSVLMILTPSSVLGDTYV
jgi:hypothetical protein